MGGIAMRVSKTGVGIGFGVATLLFATACTSPTDTAVDQPPVANTVPGDSSTTIPTPDIDVGGFSQCQTEYAELIQKMVTNPGKISPEETQRWSEQAQKAGEQAKNGDLDGAMDTICGTVDEMDKALDD
jgi:hypothetical protein